MYEITEKSELEMSHILHARDWMTQEQAQKVITEMFQLCRHHEVANLDFMVTSSIATKTVDGQMVTDTEIMIPLEKSFDADGKFCIKEKFLLTNAIVFKANYDKAMDPEFHKFMSSYLDKEKKEPITRAYTVTHKKKDSQMGTLEIYIGLNPNIL